MDRTRLADDLPRRAPIIAAGAHPTVMERFMP